MWHYFWYFLFYIHFTGMGSCYTFPVEKLWHLWCIILVFMNEESMGLFNACFINLLLFQPVCIFGKHMYKISIYLAESLVHVVEDPHFRCLRTQLGNHGYLEWRWAGADTKPHGRATGNLWKPGLRIRCISGCEDNHWSSLLAVTTAQQFALGSEKDDQ